MTESEMQRSLSALRAIIPPLTHASHKGTAGRIGVVGGSLEYTGAPYLAAISAMRAGADLSHVFCPEAAAIVIKSYSPELIVHPILSDRCSESSEAIASWLPRLHVLVIGPGLGRDPAIMNTVKSVIAVAKQQKKDIVIDADGLYLVTMEPEVVMGYPRAILTPNAAEFQRLHEKVLGSQPSPDGDSGEQTKALAAEMGNLVIVRKGHIDTISDGHQVVQCCEEGCPRRCGGQGDLLSGVTGLFSHWARQSEQRYHSSQPLPPLLVAAYGGCFLVKKCAELAYSKHHRSMLAGDMVLEIPTVFQTMLEPVIDTNQ